MISSPWSANRTRHLAGGFAGLIDIWDAINEAVIMPVFANGDNATTPLARDRGRIAMVRLAFSEARAAIQIDAIGLQTHMHQGYRGEEYMSAMLDRFARYGRPLHLTESTLISGHLMPGDIEDLNDYQIPEWPTTPEGEERQADEIVRHYRSLVAHPAVQAINYWGLTDRGSWPGAPVGLIRADGSRKPSYDALSALIKGEWWLPPTGKRTDADGSDSWLALPATRSAVPARRTSMTGGGVYACGCGHRVGRAGSP